MPLSKDQIKAVELWLDADRALEQAKKAEMAARQQLCIAVWPGTLQLGANTVELPGGGKVTVTTGWNYSFESADKVSAVCQQIESGSKDGPDIVKSLISWKPNLLTTGYKTLGMEYKALIDKVLITKPKTPSAVFKAPKDD